MGKVRLHVDGSYSPKVDYALEELRKALSMSGREVRSSGYPEAYMVVGTLRDSNRISDLVSGGKLILSRNKRHARNRHRHIMCYIEAVDDAGSGNFIPVLHPTDSIPYHVIEIER